jgi:hypothetical protein
MTHTAALIARLLALVLTLSMTGLGLLAPATAKDKVKDGGAAHVTFTKFDFAGPTDGEASSGTQLVDGTLQLSTPTGTTDYDDPFDDAGTQTTTYDVGTWTSPWVDTSFGLTELIASWNARTPEGTWIEVDVRGKTADAAPASKDYVLGRWAEDDTWMHPTSLGGQADAQATVAIDTLVTLNGTRFDSYQLEVSLMREAGSTATPTVDMVGAMASNVPATKKLEASPTTMTQDTVLPVPTYSQELHNGDFEQWDGGGEAWCSPTSTSMVVGYYNTGPTAGDYSWVTDELGAEHPDPWVDYAARHTYDYHYDGAGNWPFNTAYAGRFGLEGFVTRLRSLTEAEQFIKNGIPLVISLSFKKSQLDGAGYGTNGHLMTIVGFTADGDVVVNDPASHLIPSDDQVRVTYDRAQLEDAWIGHTGGVAYVIHDDAHPLPAAPAEANW